MFKTFAERSRNICSQLKSERRDREDGGGGGGGGGGEGGTDTDEESWLGE